MPLTCARCRAVNPDGNVYCQSCGTPLAAAAAGAASAQAPIPGPPPGPPLGAPSGPPPGFAPPTYGSASRYQSAYYAPYGAPAPVHRTSWAMIVAAVVALIVVLAGGGTALALIVNHPNPTASSGTGDLPSPTPGVTPSPIASPTSTAGNGTESNDGLTIPLPSGWSVQAKDPEAIILFDPSSSGLLTVASGLSNPTQTAQDIKNRIDNYYKTNYQDTKVCAGSTTHTGTFNGAPGNFWELCYILTSGSSAIPAVLWAFAGANNSATVYYVVAVDTTPDNLQNFLNEAKPITQGLKWKLS